MDVTVPRERLIELLRAELRFRVESAEKRRASMRRHLDLLAHRPSSSSLGSSAGPFEIRAPRGTVVKSPFMADDDEDGMPDYDAPAMRSIEVLLLLVEQDPREVFEVSISDLAIMGLVRVH